MSADDSRGLDVDHRADTGREACEPPAARRHESYRAPRWATAHVEDVDNLFAAASNSEPGGGRAQVRIDIDGVGGGKASLHDRGENLNLSVFIEREQIDELIELLEDAREDGRTRWWPKVIDEEVSQ